MASDYTKEPPYEFITMVRAYAVLLLILYKSLVIYWVVFTPIRPLIDITGTEGPQINFCNFPKLILKKYYYVYIYG